MQVVPCEAWIIDFTFTMGTNSFIKTADDALEKDTVGPLSSSDGIIHKVVRVYLKAMARIWP